MERGRAAETLRVAFGDLVSSDLEGAVAEGVTTMVAGGDEEVDGGSGGVGLAGVDEESARVASEVSALGVVTEEAESEWRNQQSLPLKQLDSSQYLQTGGDRRVVLEEF